MTRAEKVARAQQLRADGLLLREIAAEMGCAIGTAHTWLTDPDLSKQRARRERYRGACIECGARTDGSRGYDAPTLCGICAPRAVGEANRVWTRELVVARIHEWADLHGEPPAIPDWNPHHAREVSHDEARARRFEDADGHWPSASSATRLFGSWSAGLVAAGFEPRAPHGGSGNQQPSRRARAAA